MPMRLLLICGLVGSLLPVLAVEARAATGPIVIGAAPERSRFDNMRFGLAQFESGGIPELLDGGQAVSLGLDYQLAEGLALALDTFNLYRDEGGAAYFLSINPLQLRYRLGLPWREGDVFTPFATVGGGVTLMGLLGGPSGRPQFGLGPAASGSLGAIVGNGLTVELGFLGGHVGASPYTGWQLRLGTGFHSLGSLPALGAGLERARQAVLGPSAPLTGQVRAVAGDRLTLALEHGYGAVGEPLLVYYVDGITVKVARATLVSVRPDGSAVARVEVATEPIKPGYRVRAW